MVLQIVLSNANYWPAGALVNVLLPLSQLQLATGVTCTDAATNSVNCSYSAATGLLVLREICDASAT